MEDIAYFFSKLFDTSDFPARWYCGKWSDFHGWLYIISNLLIWSAYFTIPLIIIRYVTKQKQKIQFNRVYLLFAGFIIACGTSHFFDAIIFWEPLYRLNALLLLITGIISWVTIFYLIKLLPVAFSLKSPIELEKEIVLRKKHEEQLLQKNATLLRAEALAKLCSWCWNVNTNELEWSESTNDIFNLPENYNLSFEEFIETIHYDDQDSFKKSVKNAIKYRRFGKIYFRVITPTREIKDVVCVGEVVLDDRGDVKKLQGSMQDITEKRQQLRSIEEKNKQLTEISYMQSHAIRGQVATILGLTEVFNLDDYDDKKNETVIQGIKVAANSLDNIIREMKVIIEEKSGK